MGEHHRLGAAVARAREQLERAAAVGVGAVATAAGLGHGVVAAVDRIGDLQDITPRPSEGGLPVRYFGLRASRSGIGLSQEPSMLTCPACCQTTARSREGYRKFQVLWFLTLPEKAFCRQWREM